jgi:disulfide bond formation protein DsbB
MMTGSFTGRLGELLRHPFLPSAGIAALACFIIGGAWMFQLVVGLKPCPLCLEQRVPWYLLIGVGGVLVTLDTAKAPRLLLMLAFGAAFLLAIWAAQRGLYHAGVEYKWWEGPSTCTSNGGTLDPDGGLSNLSSSDVIMCDVIPWSLLGISLAGYNFLFSLVAIGLAGLGLRRALMERS